MNIKVGPYKVCTDQRVRNFRNYKDSLQLICTDHCGSRLHINNFQTIQVKSKGGNRCINLSD